MSDNGVIWFLMKIHIADPNLLEIETELVCIPFLSMF